MFSGGKQMKSEAASIQVEFVTSETWKDVFGAWSPRTHRLEAATRRGAKGDTPFCQDISLAHSAE